ncbi:MULTISPECIES: VOC family protein [Arsenicicoccus]|uniref:VOC family protein n=1 Tax=Arsenicicoccus TaxID=267408 RepID=UPI00257D5EE9|nr:MULTISPECIES: VOC family protein [Arsenicicoccus]
MRLENLVMQARDAERVGAFWTQALGLVDAGPTDFGFEGRLVLGDDLFLDLSVEQVDRAPTPSPRLHPDLAGGARQQEVVDRLLGLGARHLDVGQRDVPWVVLADPDGNPFCVMEDREAFRDTGPIAALPLDSADPERDAALYAALTGWVQGVGSAPVTLRHPSLRGPLLELWRELSAKQGQNRLHLDVRPEADDPSRDELVDLALTFGATRADDDWAQGHPWVVLRDTSGNELCILDQLDG